ncbi:MAG: thiamine-phosphate synthase family protein [Nitrososphaerota archaeon]
MMVSHLLPNLRGVLAHRLRRAGFRQSSIANMLGVTQAAVSQILRKPETAYIMSLTDMGLSREEAGLLIRLLEDDVKLDPVRANTTLYAFWRKFLSDGKLCDFHRRLRPQLASCDICLSPSGPSVESVERGGILRKLEDCVALLERSGAVSALMPQVSMNLVYSVERPTSISDVAGIPGRIVKVAGRVSAVGKPAFGGSQHLASVVLAINNRDNRVRAAINIRNDFKVKKIVESMGITYAVAALDDRPPTEEKVINSVARAYPLGGKLPIAIFHEGGYGYEPTTYIFGETPQEVTRTVLEIATRYLSSYSQT